jgi:magnesium transporter
LAAAVSGTTIPFPLKKVRIDPAISGAVILTSVTEFFGFSSLASVML